jgi:hypothetical protein
MNPAGGRKASLRLNKEALQMAESKGKFSVQTWLELELKERKDKLPYSWNEIIKLGIEQAERQEGA